MEINNLPESLQNFKKLPPLRNANIDHKQNLSFLRRIALWITAHVGSMGFFLIIFFWTVLWLGWNIFGPQHLRFDPYPGFILWLFISNMIQIFLMPLIMIGQNLQSQHAEVRAEVDFEINTKAELEIQKILGHLENQNKLILKILEEIRNNRNVNEG